MGLLNKLGIGVGGQAPRAGVRSLPETRTRHNGNGTAVAPAVGSHREPELQTTTRISNGLKDFLWHLDGLGRGNLLDLGPAWQTTLNFFIERGFRVTSEDVLRGWMEFQKEQDAPRKEALTAEDYAERTPEARAKKFLRENFQYAPSSFDALLLWDVLDYLEPVVAR